MNLAAKFFSILACIGLLIFLLGFISLFNNELGFSGVMTAENWNKFQVLSISGGMALSWLAGTLAYVFLGKK